MNYYGYSLKEINADELYNLIYDILLAFQYTEKNKYIFCFIKDENELLDNQNTWHSYFISFPIIEKQYCIGIWPNLIVNDTVNDCNMNDYSNIIKNEILIFQPHIYKEISSVINDNSLFSAIDIGLSIDTIQDLPIEIYISECEKMIDKYPNEINTIYISSEDLSICFKMKDYFQLKKINILWDKQIYSNKIIHILKNLFIMKNAKIRIGARISNFFRIVELYSYPSESINIQDGYSIAPYSSIEYLIRPSFKRRIPHFINQYINNPEQIQVYKKMYLETGMVTIPNFISSSILSDIKSEIENYPWWIYAIFPDNTLNQPRYEKEITENSIELCSNMLEMQTFTYRFRRSFIDHFSDCVCITCRLYDTIKSFQVTEYLCKIINCNNLEMNELFLSNYSKDDFLTIHGDIKKGDISITFSLTYDWNPVYGGILHFCDKYKNIYKSIVPTLGSANIFKLPKEDGLDHFVSTVNVNKNRYTLTTWFTIIN